MGAKKYNLYWSKADINAAQTPKNNTSFALIKTCHFGAPIYHLLK